MFVQVSSTTRGRDLVVNIASKSLTVALKTSDHEVLLEGELEEAINVEDSCWTLDDGQITIVLEKRVKTWWKHVIIGHPEIDTSKVSDLDVNA